MCDRKKVINIMICVFYWLIFRYERVVEQFPEIAAAAAAGRGAGRGGRGGARGGRGRGGGRGGCPLPVKKAKH